MATVKLKAPEGCSGISVSGFQVDVDADGNISIDEAHVADLVSHGFTPLVEQVTTLRSQLIQNIVSGARGVAENLDDAALQAFVNVGSEKLSPFWQSMAEAIKAFPKLGAQPTQAVNDPPKPTAPAPAPTPAPAADPTKK